MIYPSINNIASGTPSGFSSPSVNPFSGFFDSIKGNANSFGEWLTTPLDELYSSNPNPDIASLNTAVEDFNEMAQNNTDIANQTTSDWLNKVMEYNQSSVDEANKLAQANAQDVMNFNASEAEKNREWQEYMSNTSISRMMSQIEDAGLNPLLVYNLGGASTPSGASASVSNSSFKSASASSGSASVSQVTDKLVSGLVDLMKIDSSENMKVVSTIGSILSVLLR